MKKMQIYIWREVRRDYTPGIAFAVARSKAEAIEAIHKTSDPGTWEMHAGDLLQAEPEVHDIPYGDWKEGGG